MVRMFSAIAAAWPCSSAATPGSRPGGVDQGHAPAGRAGRPAASAAAPCGSPAGLAMPKLRATSSAVRCPFWWPITATGIGRPAGPARRRSPGSPPPSRSPCSSTKPSKAAVEIVQCGRPARGRRASRDRPATRSTGPLVRDAVGRAAPVARCRRGPPVPDRTAGRPGAGRGEQRQQPVPRRAGAATTRSTWPWRSRKSAVWKPSGRVWPSDLADHPGPGEAHPGAALGDDHVGAGGERGGHPAVRRVGDAR